MQQSRLEALLFFPFLSHALIYRINGVGPGGGVVLMQVADSNRVQGRVGLIVCYESDEDLYSGDVKTPVFTYQRATQCSRAVIKMCWILESSEHARRGGAASARVRVRARPRSRAAYGPRLRSVSLCEKSAGGD